MSEIAAGDPKRVLSRLGSLEDEIERLRAINAELLAALEDLADLHDGDDPVGYTREVARAAIANTKEK